MEVLPVFHHGDRVVCLRGDIDRQRHVNEIGVISGFARLSTYHPREASVRFEDGSAAYFWLRDLEKVEDA